MSIFQGKLAENFLQALTSACVVFNGGQRELMSMSTNEDNIQAPVNRFRDVITQTNNLLMEINNLSGSDHTREPKLTPALYDRIIELYKNVQGKLQDMRKVRDQALPNSYSEYETVNLALDIFLNSQPENWLNDDLNNLYHEKGLARTTEETEQFLEEVTGDVNLEQEPESQEEYLKKPHMIPNAVICSGDSKDLASFYLSNEQTLHENEKEYLRHRMRSLKYVELLTERNRVENKKLTKIVEGGTGDNWTFSMPDLQLYEHQTSSNGCWSCAYQLLLQSRGVLLDQKTIRSFRPGLNSAQAMKLMGSNTAPMLGDAMGSPFEMTDLTMKLLPNTAMLNTTLTLSTDAMDPRNPGYQTMAAKFNQTVEKALRNNKSPVAISNGVHFRTITGRLADGRWQIRDSQDTDPRKYRYLSTAELIEWSRTTAAQRAHHGSIQLTWLRDLNLQQDGSCTDLENDGFRRVHFDNNVIAPEPEIPNVENEADSDFELSLESHNFVNRPRYPYNLQVTESASVPKVLNPQVHLELQKNFVPGPQFLKWQRNPLHMETDWNDIPDLSEIQDLSEISPDLSKIQDQSETSNRNDIPDLGKIQDLKMPPFMSKEQFNQKLKTDQEFKGIVESLKGKTVPLWRDPGKEPEPLDEPAPVEPVHGALARFGNWLRKIFTGVDRYAEENNMFLQNLADWNDRQQQRETQIQAYQRILEDNVVFEDAYNMMSHSWQAEQEKNLPDIRKVRAGFRKKIEESIQNAVNELDTKSLSEACGNVLADRYLAETPKSWENGPDAYKKNLRGLSQMLTETVADLLNNNESLTITLTERLLDAKDTDSREKNILNLLDRKVISKCKQQVKNSQKNKVNPEPEKKSEWSLFI